MEAFDPTMEFSGRWQDEVLDIEERIKAITGVFDAKILPNDKESYIMHISLRVGACQVNVLLEAHGVIKEFGKLSGIRLWRWQKPIELAILADNNHTTVPLPSNVVT